MLNAKTAEKRISHTIVRTLIAFVAIIALKTFQIIHFYDAKTGLLNETIFKNVLTVLVYIIIGYVVVEYVLLVRWIRDNIGYVESKSTQIGGLVLIIVGFCFMIQGIMGLLPHLFASVIDLRSVLTDIFCLLSAVTYFIKGMSIVLGNKKQYMGINIVPVIWSMLVLLDVMLTYPIIISVQTGFSKALTAAFLTLFMYYDFRCNCGYEKEFKSWASVFVRISFGFIMGAWNLPYCIAYLFKVRDDTINMPYIALLGLLLYGFIILMQYMSQAVIKVEKRDSLIDE